MKKYVCIAMLACVAAWAGPVEDFKAAILSDDINVRFDAAMNAGPLGAEALPIVLEYWDAEAPGPRKAARVALPVIVRESKQPGNEKQRAAVCDALIAATDSTYATGIRREALHHLGSLASGDHVKAIAALLSDLEVQEQAAQALENIPGDEAAQAILAAVDEAAPAFRVQLMHALAARGAMEAIPTLTKHARSSDERSRWGGIESLARLGVVPVHVVPLWPDATSDERTRYMHNTLTAADALVEQGKADKAEPIYLSALHTHSSMPHVVAYALTGLVNMESKETTARAIGFLGVPGTHEIAMDVLIGGTEKDMESKLARAFDKVDVAKQVSILRILAARKSSEIDKLLGPAASARPAVQWQAARIKGDTSLPDALIADVATNGPIFARGDAIRDLIARAEASPEKAVDLLSTLAGEAFPEATRIEAVTKLAMHKSAETTLNDLAAKQSGTVVDAAVQRAQIKFAASYKQTDEAEAQILDVVAKRADHSVLQSGIDAMQQIGKDPTAVAASLGFLAHWKVLGPIPHDSVESVEDSIRAAVAAGKAATDVQISGDDVPAWKDATIDAWPPVLDLRKHYARHRNMAAIAVFVPGMQTLDPGNYKAIVNSTDPYALSVNGDRVIEETDASKLSEDAAASISLTDNPAIVMKTLQQDDDWRFSVRLVKE